jgi:hypothetical protein
MISALTLELIFRSKADCRLPQTVGPALRGAFGYALKRLVCVMRGRPCQGCPLEDACHFPAIFAPAPPEGSTVMRLYERAPPPFALRVAKGGGPMRAGEALVLRVLLIGSAVRTAPFVLRAFAEAAENGFGAGRAPFMLEEVLDVAGVTAVDENRRIVAAPHVEHVDPVAPSHVRVTFDSPVRLQGDGVLVTPERFEPGRFCMAAVRRIGLLAQFYAPPVSIDFKALKEACGRVGLRHADLGWKDAERYSTRQKTALKIGGMTGQITLDIGRAPELWPFLAAAGRFGVGKATTMGFGAITTEAA